MKKLFMMAPIVITIILLIGCTNNKAVSDSTNIVKVDTKELSVILPSYMQYKNQPGDMIIITKDSIDIGGVNIMAYYSEEPFSQLYPNHSENYDVKKLEGFPTESYQVKMDYSSKDTSVKHAIHFYYLEKEKKLAIDLYFDSKNVDDNTALKIAKSLILK